LRRNKKIPFGRWENFEACVTDMREQDHDEESAQKICGAIKDRVEKGFIYKAVDDTLEILSKSEPEIVVGGFATYEIQDPQNDVVTIEGQKAWLKSLFRLQPEYRAASYEHTDLKIGSPLRKYVAPDGQEYFSHVNEKGTYIITKVRPEDGTETMRFIHNQLRKGELGMYSIAGKPQDGMTISKREGQSTVNYRNGLEAWGYALCKNGVNPKAKTQLIAKSTSETEKRRRIKVLGRLYGTNTEETPKNKGVPFKLKVYSFKTAEDLYKRNYAAGTVVHESDVGEEGADVDVDMKPGEHYMTVASYGDSEEQLGSLDQDYTQFMFMPREKPTGPQEQAPKVELPTQSESIEQERKELDKVRSNRDVRKAELEAILQKHGFGSNSVKQRD